MVLQIPPLAEVPRQPPFNWKFSIHVLPGYVGLSLHQLTTGARKGRGITGEKYCDEFWGCVVWSVDL